MSGDGAEPRGDSRRAIVRRRRWALLAAGALVVVAVIFFTPELRDPGIPMALFGPVVLSLLPLLLMIVMRGLLQQASGYRAELDEVI